MSATPHVFTLTGNLLAEHTLDFPAWSIGKTQRATCASFQVGGKGINVAKMLARLGAAHTALCFTGGTTGADCVAWLREKRFSFHAFPNERPTRLGTVIRSPAQPETTFFTPDVPPSAAALRACAAFLDAQPAGQVLAICGSLPGWIGAEFDPLRAALERWLRRGVLAVDTYGPPLAWFAALPVALIKINATELASLAGHTATVPATLAEAPARWPVARWIVSDGPAAVWFRDRANAPASLLPPTVAEASPTGSGDVLFACLLHALFLRDSTLPAALAAALPLAAANAAHPGVADFPFADLAPFGGASGACGLA